ncbi:hypothetical protein P154DRAFT_557414 [Amniculicola lignicola CBS 123094]|uniref:DUF7924 domain-containing protein n=1 Tax=Amniculicola lignicola CBS 123094 TaxID=1392246 RepID=A0A6A5VYR1_9PLEO|nr:hypothetical protein P154DRAFT_557414 [Amniculicola lignicola CBS 123094]
MNGGVSKLPDGVTRTCAAGSHVNSYSGVELLPSPREQPPANRDLTRGLQSTKRRLNATPEIDPQPLKRARLSRTDAQPTAEDGKTSLQQPKPEPPRFLYASFLKEFVDPVHSVGPNPSPDPPAESTHTFISEWLESVGPGYWKSCHSDSHLYHPHSDPVPRTLTRSAPEMSHTRDADGYMMPPTPASTGSRSYRADADAASVVPSDITGSGRSSGRSLVEDPFYREQNLAANGIHMRRRYDPVPEHIASLVDHVRQDRNSPGPSSDEVWQDTDLYNLSMGAGESKVEDYFKGTIFPNPGSSGTLDRADRQPMSKHTVPSTGSKFKVSNPVPDMLYGYNRLGAFPDQQIQLISMGNENGTANNQGLLYPFFAIEFKGDGPAGTGSMWVATNQCLGASASCVNIAERLNHQLRQCKSDKVQPIDSAAFSIAMNGTEARLYISWKHNELEHYMRQIKSFLLQEPEHYLEFRKYVRNIVEWGKERRLKEIRDSLDILLEESRKRTSQIAKSRPPSTDGSRGTGGKKHKSSSSSRNSSRSNSMQRQSGEGESCYKWDTTVLRWFHINTDGTITWAEEGELSRSVASAE